MKQKENILREAIRLNSQRKQDDSSVEDMYEKFRHWMRINRHIFTEKDLGEGKGKEFYLEGNGSIIYSEENHQWT